MSVDILLPFSFIAIVFKPLWFNVLCVHVIQTKTARELEQRMKHLSVEVEKGNALRQKVTQEKGQLEIHVASLSAELQEANRRSVAEIEIQQYKMCRVVNRTCMLTSTVYT